MPRYMVERSFDEPLEVPATADGAQALMGVVDNNAELGVTWVRSFVSSDHKKTFCIYDGPSPESIQEAAGKSNLPLDSITEVSVLDPYFYVSST